MAGNVTNTTVKAETKFKFYDEPTSLMEAATITTTGLFVAGVFFNCIAIGVFSSRVFQSMSFSAHMKIICCFNIAVLLLGMIRHHSFMLDVHSNTVHRMNSFSVCLYVVWFMLVMDNSRAFSISLTIYNRIKAQRVPDTYSKTIEAVRVPVLTNASVILLCSVPVSSYIEAYDQLYRNTSDRGCALGFLRPYEGMHLSRILMSNLSLMEETLNVFLIVVLFIEIILRHSRLRKQLAKKVDARGSSDEHVLSFDSKKTATFSRVTSRVGIVNRDDIQEGTFDLGANKYSMDASAQISDVSLPTGFDYKDDETNKEYCATSMTVVMVFMHLMTSAPRRLQHTLFVTAIFPELRVTSFEIMCVLDVLQYVYHAFMFLLLCLTGSLYRSEAFRVLFQTDPPAVSSNMSLATATRMMNNLLRRTIDSSFTETRALSTASKEYGAIIENFELDRDALMLMPSEKISEDAPETYHQHINVSKDDSLSMSNCESFDSETDLDKAKVDCSEVRFRKLIRERHNKKKIDKQKLSERKKQEREKEIVQVGTEIT
ncbi:uncharacterized protein LOC131928509 isoform X2 [Physella acuta]|uniref:uncharacterized protein LOC131928509 isoform X2 n=1 Tax=Physella acuta TaxID=109671 RepID=UPI0027DCC04E|nr:uncharacterized protein LOC131928509 isoform X2 [Physella acuta]